MAYRHRDKHLSQSPRLGKCFETTLDFSVSLALWSLRAWWDGRDARDHPLIIRFLLLDVAQTMGWTLLLATALGLVDSPVVELFVVAEFWISIMNESGPQTAKRNQRGLRCLDNAFKLNDMVTLDMPVAIF